MVSEQVEPSASVAARIWAPLRDRWWLLASGTLLAVALTLAVQALQTPTWTARAVMAPAPPRPGLSGGAKLGGLSKIAGLAGVDLGKEGVSDFEKFQSLIYSDRLGVVQAARPGMLRMLFPGLWDLRTGRWVPPQGLVQSIKSALYPSFGLLAWQPPDGRDIAKRYETDLSVRPVGKTDMIQLSFVDSDPARATYVLRAIIADADDLLRRDAAHRASAQARYLRTRLQTTEIRDYRDNLVELLAQQEQTLMLTNSSLPYAVETLQPPSVSKTPTSQRPILYAGIAMVMGFSLSAFIAVLLGPKRDPRPRDAIALP